MEKVMPLNGSNLRLKKIDELTVNPDTFTVINKEVSSRSDLRINDNIH